MVIVPTPADAVAFSLPRAHVGQSRGWYQFPVAGIHESVKNSGDVAYMGKPPAP